MALVLCSRLVQGTLLFMAAEVLANAYLPWSPDNTPFRHAVDHDLESFVWVLLHLAVSTPEYEKAKSYLARRLPQLGAVDTDITMFSGEKHMFWVDTLKGWSDMGSLLQDHPLWNATNALHKTIIKYRNNKNTTTTASLYEGFAKILDSAAEELSVTESRKRPFEPSTPPKTSRKRVKTIVYRTPPNLRPRDKKPNYREDSE